MKVFSFCALLVAIAITTYALTNKQPDAVKVGVVENSQPFIKYEPMPLLESELGKMFNVRNVHALEIIEEGDAYWLKGKANSGSNNSVLAIMLVEKSGALSLRVETATHTCTCRSCCLHCDLNINSDTSGECDCQKAQVYEACADDLVGQTCSHTVSEESGGADITALVTNLHNGAD